MAGAASMSIGGQAVSGAWAACGLAREPRSLRASAPSAGRRMSIGGPEEHEIGGPDEHHEQQRAHIMRAGG